MRKTFESINKHVSVDSAYIPLRPEARGCCDSIREIPVDDVTAVDENVAAIDPAVVVYNHRFRVSELDFYEEYPLVHVRHGASIGRGERQVTTKSLATVVHTALAPGTRWETQYRKEFPRSVRVETVGVPEADEFVSADAPREKRVLYAPTNHNYGGGSYTNTAEDVLETFADSEYELLFRPHPHDRTEEPGKSVTGRCKDRIAEMSNVTFDERPTPRQSMLESDLLVSDYSGIVTEWLHTGRPLIQLTDIAAPSNEVPEIGHTTDVLDLELVDDLYNQGARERSNQYQAAFVADLGIPMDGRAGERAAKAVVTCTQ